MAKGKFEALEAMSSDLAPQTSDLSSQFAGQFVQNGKNQVQLVGSHFENPVYVVPIAIACIGTLAFMVLIFFLWLKKKDVKGSRKAFAALLALLHGMFLLFARNLADQVTHETEPTVSEGYLVLPILKPILKNGSDVALILMVYRIIKNRNCWITGDKKGYPKWQLSHRFVKSLLVFVGTADAAVYIYAEVICFTQTQLGNLSNAHASGIMTIVANCYKWVYLAYVTIYLLTALEMCFCAGFILVKAAKKKLHSRIMLYLTYLILPSLLIRSINEFILALIYGFNNVNPAVGALIGSILWSLPSIVIFVGLVLIQYQRDWEAGTTKHGHGHGPVVEVDLLGKEVKEGAGMVRRETERDVKEERVVEKGEETVVETVVEEREEREDDNKGVWNGLGVAS